MDVHRHGLAALIKRCDDHRIAFGFVNRLRSLSSTRLMCDTQRMNIASPNRDKHHGFPVEIVSHGVWLYYHFCLSHRDVEELLFARMVIVTSEAIRKWSRTFSPPDANALRSRRPGPGDTWH
jgi:hypothetical protein